MTYLYDLDQITKKMRIKMDWTQAFAIIGSLGAFTFWLFTKLDNDIKASNTRFDNEIKASNARQDAQMNRIDQLYQMFIDLLKEGRDK